MLRARQGKKLAAISKFIIVTSLLMLIETALFGQTINIAIVSEQNIAQYKTAQTGFEAALAEKGYNKGKNIELIYYDIKAEKLISKIKEKNPAVICAIGTETALYIKKNITDIPIVFSMVHKPVEVNLVKAGESSNGNITGASLDVSANMQLELIKKVTPKLIKVGVLYDPWHSRKIITEAKQLEEQLNLKIVGFEVKSPLEIAKALKDNSDKIDILWLIPDESVCTKDSLQYIVTNCLNLKIPIAGFAAYLVKAGALFGYVFDYGDVGRQAGELAVKILAGESPGNLAVTTPRKIGYVINLKIAALLNVKISQEVLSEAEEVYK